MVLVCSPHIVSLLLQQVWFISIHLEAFANTNEGKQNEQYYQGLNHQTDSRISLNEDEGLLVDWKPKAVIQQLRQIEFLQLLQSFECAVSQIDGGYVVQQRIVIRQVYHMVFAACLQSQRVFIKEVLSN